MFDVVGVERALARMPPDDLLQDAVMVLRALGDGTRAAMILALSEVPELCVSDLARISGSKLDAASAHLRILRTHGLVRQRPEGRLTFYSLADPTLGRLAAALIRAVASKPGATKSRKQWGS